MQLSKQSLSVFDRESLLSFDAPKKTESQMPLRLQRLTEKYEPDKARRFEAFYLEQQGHIIQFDVPNQMMKGSQLRQEKEDFTAILEEHSKAQAP